MNRRCLFGSLAAMLVFAIIVAAARTSMGQFVEWSRGLQTALAYMGLTLPMLGVLLLGVLLTFAAVWMFWRAQRASRNVNAFDAAEMFQDERGKTSGTKVMAFVGGLLSLWVIAFLTVSDKLTGEIFGGWLLIIVAGKVSSELVAAKWGSGSSGHPEQTDAAPDPRKG